MVAAFRCAQCRKVTEFHDEIVRDRCPRCCGNLEATEPARPTKHHEEHLKQAQAGAERLGLSWSDARHWSAAMARWAAKGFPVRSRQQVAWIERECCRPCEHYQDGRCTHCRCRVNTNPIAAANKIKMATEDCPLGRWTDPVESVTAFVYPYLAKAAEGDELLYSVRSVEKYFQGKADIWIVGDRPAWWARDDRFVKAQQVKGGARIDRANKLWVILNTPEIPEEFVWMQDDIYFVKPVSYEFLATPWTRGKAMTPERLKTWEPEKGFFQQKKKTFEALLAGGKTLEDYAAHTPQVYEKENLRVLFEKYDLRKQQYVDDLLYYNEFPQGKPVPIGNRMYRITGEPDEETYWRRMGPARLHNHFNGKYREFVAPRIKTLFPQSCSHEKRQTMVAVVGSGRSGTSCVAGILHKLGIPMGGKLLRPNGKNPSGYFEDTKLRKFCIRAFGKGCLQDNMTRQEREQWFLDWAAARRKDGEVIGCKHPHLCMMLPELKAAWPDLRVIATERPLDEIVGSLKHAHWWKRGRDPERLIRQRDEDLRRLGIPVLRVPFDELLGDTNRVVDEIIDFVGIEPTPLDRGLAKAHVQPELSSQTSAIRKPGDQPATLLYHFCPYLGRPEMIDFHLKQLARYLPQFSKVRINIATGKGLEKPEVIESQLRPYIHTDDVKFLHIPNDRYAECTPFFEHLLPEVGPEEKVCYGHTKGVAYTKNREFGRVWAELMYVHCMGAMRESMDLLDKHPCVGPFLRRRPARGAKWVYGGNFFWFNPGKLQRYPGYFIPRKYKNRWVSECWLGKFVPLEDAAETIPERARLRLKRIMRKAA